MINSVLLIAVFRVNVAKLDSAVIVTDILDLSVASSSLSVRYGRMFIL